MLRRAAQGEHAEEISDVKRIETFTGVSAAWLIGLDSPDPDDTHRKSPWIYGASVTMGPWDVFFRPLVVIVYG